MQAQSRKRPAPGTSPLPPNTQQETTQNTTLPDASQLSNDQFLSWGATNDFVPAQNNQASASAADGMRMGQYNPAQQPANQLVRRNINQTLATLDGRNTTPSALEMWQEYEGTPPPGMDASEETDAELEAKAAAAKRDALSKRPPKQIPPFIQKLVSFLEKNYTDLIRWSDAGDSFIVVDEDKFAQKLIPELFKHNNYASFVRQLNMYGFHKVVGLSDNSMRASEKKAKTPSEYKHRYFKRGRPELLWLIEKPKSGAATTKKKNVKQEMQEDDEDEHDAGAEGQVDDGQHQPPNKDLTTMPKADTESFRNLRKEVEALQKSQQQIFSILARMRDENNQYIRQASAMVANHERHESSINAILTFLATFYNQTLEDRGNTGNMFAHALHNNQPQGSVYDVGDYADSPSNQPSPFQPQPRRPLALLPPPTTSDDQTGSGQKSSGSPATESTSSRKPTSRPLRSTQQATRPQAQSSPQQNALNAPSPTKDNDDILNVINRSNANPPQSSQNGPNFDFNSALQHYQNANGKGPLSAEQRDAMLSIMANHSGTSTPAVTTDNSNVNPYFDYFNSNHQQLEMLQRMQEEQDSRVQELAGRLTPLSPSGSIPGLALPAGGASQSPNASNASLPYSATFDIDNFLDNDYLDGNNDTSPDFDFGRFGDDDAHFDATGAPASGLEPQDAKAATGSHDSSLFGDDDNGDDDDGNGGDQASGAARDSAGGGEGGGRIVGSVESSSGRPTPSVEEVADEDDGDAEGKVAEEQNPSKRRRTTRR